MCARGPFWATSRGLSAAISPGAGMLRGAGPEVPVVGEGNCPPRRPLEYLIGGATPVQVGCAHFRPRRPKNIDGISRYLKAQNLRYFFPGRQPNKMSFFSVEEGRWN